MSKKFTGLWRTPAQQEPGINVKRLVDKKGEPWTPGQRAYDKDTGRLAQVGLTQMAQLNPTDTAPPASNQLTLFAEDSLASLTVSPGSEEARTMTATSGLNFYALLEKSDPLGLLQRMFQASYHCISTRCYLTWKVKATPAGRLIFQLAPSMPRTEGNASSLLPSPRAQDSYERSNWKTIVKANETGEAQMTLTRKVKYEAKMFPTPQNRDWKGKSQRGGTEGNRDCLPNVTGGQLNPTWVEWLMGFPEKWTEVD